MRVESLVACICARFADGASDECEASVSKDGNAVATVKLQLQ